jgi:hypothetical protein
MCHTANENRSPNYPGIVFGSGSNNENNPAITLVSHISERIKLEFRRTSLKEMDVIRNDGNRNLIQRDKYTVNSAGIPLFPIISNINIPAESQQKFKMMY